MEHANDFRPSLNPKFEAAVRRKREHERLAAARAEARKLQRQKVRDSLRVVAPEPEYRTIVVRELPSGKKIIKDLVTAVAIEHDMTYEDIIGDRRSRPIIKARHEAMRIVADARPDMSIASLARFFNRDHSSLLFALKKTRKPGALR